MLPVFRCFLQSTRLETLRPTRSACCTQFQRPYSPYSTPRPPGARIWSRKDAAVRPSFRTQFCRPYYLYSNTPRPASLRSRIWFRKDGTPRSKLRGLVMASLLTGLVYATWTTLLALEALDYERYLLSTLVYIQRVDYDYTTVEFAEFSEAMAYFEDLCGYFCNGDVLPELLASFFRDIVALESARETVHATVRDAARAVHDLLAQSKGADATETAVRVITILDEAMMGLIELTEEASGDETDKMLRIKRLKDQMTPKEASKGYEVLG